MAEEKEKPLTREDVLRLIEQNGGKAEGLDLSGKVFEEGIDLRDLHLKGIILMEAILPYAQFQGSRLWNAHLEGADLSFAHFEGAQLHFAYLAGAILWFAEFSPTTVLEGIDWGNYILGEEKKENFAAAEVTYRRLKTLHTNAGHYDIAGEFLFREMEAKRRNLRWLQPQERRWLGWWPLRGQKVRLNVYKWLYGYGERPWRVLAWAALVVFLVACAHFFTAGILTLSAFGDSLYYSAVSFTALGYGRWAPQPMGWVKGLGAFEAFIGVFMMALFLITFVKKMTR